MKLFATVVGLVLCVLLATPGLALPCGADTFPPYSHTGKLSHAPLKSYTARTGITMGVLFDQMPSALKSGDRDSDYADILGNFNAATINGFSWSYIAPNYHIYRHGAWLPRFNGEVRQGDIIEPVFNPEAISCLKARIRYLRDRGYTTVQASHLTWGAKDWQASWLWQDLETTRDPIVPAAAIPHAYRLLTREQYLHVMEAYVRYLVQTFSKASDRLKPDSAWDKGAYIDVWSVANEFFSEVNVTFPKEGGNFWLDKINHAYRTETQSHAAYMNLGQIEDTYLGKLLMWTAYADSSASALALVDTFSLSRQSRPLHPLLLPYTAPPLDTLSPHAAVTRHAVLLLNDNDDESMGSYITISGKNREIIADMYATLKALKAQGIRVDAAGMQMHLDATIPPEQADVAKVIRYFGTQVDHVYITEIDVRLPGRGTNYQKLVQQARVYRRMLDACLATRPVCSSYTIWGVGDKQSYEPSSQLLLFNKTLVGKPAFYSIHRGLTSDFADPCEADDPDKLIPDLKQLMLRLFPEDEDPACPSRKRH